VVESYTTRCGIDEQLADHLLLAEQAQGVVDGGARHVGRGLEHLGPDLVGGQMDRGGEQGTRAISMRWWVTGTPAWRRLAMASEEA
jgi:hypothetical protein